MVNPVNCIKVFRAVQIGRVNVYPTMHYFRIPRHTQSMIDNKIVTEYFSKLQGKIALWACCCNALYY